MIKRLGSAAIYICILIVAALVAGSQPVQAATLPVVLDSPLSNSTQGAVLVEYTLGEEPLSNSLHLTFSGSTTVSITLAPASPAVGYVAFYLDPTNLASSPVVQASTANVIPDGSYTVTFAYQNAQGDPAYTVTSTNVTIDSGLLDTNADGLPDFEQPNISSYINSYTGKRVVIDVGQNCETTVDDLASEASLPAQDPGYEYEHGLFDFEADCYTPGTTTTIKLYYYDLSTSSLVVRKFNPHTLSYSTISGATLEQRTINGHSVAVVSYQVTDGGALDMDSLENGQIADPAGVGLAVSTSHITGSVATLASTGLNAQLVAVVAILSGTSSLFVLKFSYNRFSKS